MLPAGPISGQGNTPTAGQQIRLSGLIKRTEGRTVLGGVAYWASVTGDSLSCGRNLQRPPA